MRQSRAHAMITHLTRRERQLSGNAETINRVNVRLGPCGACRRPWSAHLGIRHAFQRKYRLTYAAI